MDAPVGGMLRNVREVVFEDLIHGQTVLTFDGRVVELFTEQNGTLGRIHLRQLHCKATGPNRKGYFEAQFSPSSSGRSGFTLTVADGTWPSLQPLIAEIDATKP